MMIADGTDAASIVAIHGEVMKAGAETRDTGVRLAEVTQLPWTSIQTAATLESSPSDVFDDW